MLNRRNFSKAGMLTAAAAFTPKLTRDAHAQEIDADPHFFIYVQIFGAWDVCLAIDPKDRDSLGSRGQKLFDQPYDFSAVTDYNGIRLAPQGQVLAPYTSKMTIVNGIDMLADNGHIPDAAMSGIQNPRSSNQAFLQAIVAAKHSYVRSRSIPHLYLSYDGQFFAGSYSGKSINSSVADFANLFGSAVKKRAHGTDLQALLLRYRDALPDAQSKLTFNDYIKSVTQAGQVAQKLRDSGFEPPTEPDSPSGIGNFLALLFQSGVLGSATLSFGSRYSFDTHSNHYAMHPLGKALNDIALISEELKRIPFSPSESIFDRTTIVVTGEYARTPLLNSSQGKDHNFRTNSALFMGRNVNSGVYGASGERVDSGTIVSHAALPIDFATGHPTATGQVLKMKDVWAGSSRIFGTDLSADFGTDAKPVTFL